MLATHPVVQVIRLLDPQEELLKREHWKHHLVCVSRDAKKSLRAALHHPIDVMRYKRTQDSLQDADGVEEDDGVDEDDTVPLPTCAFVLRPATRLCPLPAGRCTSRHCTDHLNHQSYEP
jgi:hypothetical protein